MSVLATQGSVERIAVASTAQTIVLRMVLVMMASVSVTRAGMAKTAAK